MISRRALGATLLAIGIGLIVLGLNASHSIADQWNLFSQGHYTDSAVWLTIGGVAMALTGLTLVSIVGRRILR